MRKNLFFLSVLSCLLLFSGCSKRSEFFAMDTVITMEVSGLQAEDAILAAEKETLYLEDLFSVQDADSDIAVLNETGAHTVHQETADLLQTAKELSVLTNGAYDCTVEPVVDLWGWFNEPSVPDEDALQAAKALIGSQYLQIDETRIAFLEDQMGVDLGGIAKGYAAGRLEDLFREYGIRSGILSLGGNVRAIGSKPNGQPWVIGIADPNQPSSYLCTIAVTDKAVVTSGDYQRFFSENGQLYHHIIDPKTGMPAQNGLQSVTVVCEDDTMADGLSTALFVMGLDDAAVFWRSGLVSFEAVFITEQSILITEGLCSDFSCQQEFEVICR